MAELRGSHRKLAPSKKKKRHSFVFLSHSLESSSKYLDPPLLEFPSQCSMMKPFYSFWFCNSPLRLLSLNSDFRYLIELMFKRFLKLGLEHHTKSKKHVREDFHISRNYSYQASNDMSSGKSVAYIIFSD